jgi:hypothetical protein
MWIVLGVGVAALWIAKECPAIAGWLLFLIVCSTLVMAVDPAAGAGLVLLTLGAAALVGLVFMLPYIIGFAIGILFILLFIIGLGKLVGG